MTDVAAGEVLLPPAEAARRLRVSVKTLRIWEEAGRITATRDGRNRRYPEAAVEELRRELVPGSPPEREFLAPREAAAMLGVEVKALGHLEATGKLTSARTPGGHRRWRADGVARLLREREGARP